MKLFNGIEKKVYIIKNINLPAHISSRLEALGMTCGTRVRILNKNKTAVIIIIRGTRFALGRAVAQKIIVGEDAPQKTEIL